MQQGHELAAISMISCMCARLQTMHALIFARTGMPFDHHQAQDNLGGALQPALDDVKLCAFFMYMKNAQSFKSSEAQDNLGGALQPAHALGG